MNNEKNIYETSIILKYRHMFILIFAFLVGNVLFASHAYATVPARIVIPVYNIRLRAKYIYIFNLSKPYRLLLFQSALQPLVGFRPA
jgi:hypothetical protein